MKKTFLTIGCLLLLSIQDLCALENARDNEIAAQADRLMQQFYQENRSPGLSVSVGLNCDIIWSQGYGYADLEQRGVIQLAGQPNSGSCLKPAWS